jgi:hypothetical protein
VEKEGDRIKKAWKHFYGPQLPFPGYKNMPADMVTLGFSRDIILDPFNRVPTGEEMGQKPKDKIGIKNWIAKIAENQRHIYRAKRETTTVLDRVLWTEIAVIILMLLAWGAKYALG